MKLQIEDLSLSIAQTRICERLNLNFAPCECWAILGINGCGKTTLLKTLAGLQLPQAGQILLGGLPLQQQPRKQLARNMGLLAQHQQDQFPATVLETVLVGRHPYLPAWQWESAEDHAIAQQVLELVGMTAFAHRSVLTLSGGERQRVAIATLLAQTTDILLLDEPVNHLDIHQQHHVMQLLTTSALCRQTTRIMVLHDMNLASRYCDHALLIFGNGEVIAGETEQVLTAENLSRLYHYPVTEHRQHAQRLFIAE